MDAIKITKGKEKIILSAPHSVLHMRENCMRSREIRTSTIVKILSSKCSLYSIYKTKSECNDANWDENYVYKSTLEKLIKDEKIKILIDYGIVIANHIHLNK